MKAYDIYFPWRENAFLNASPTQPTNSEKIADFFLAPSHYLFAGRTLTHIKTNISQAEKFIVSQRFDYSDDSLTGNISYFFKTILSVLALPISLILGSLAKLLVITLDPAANKHYQEFKEFFASKTVIPTQYTDYELDEIFSEEMTQGGDVKRGPLACPELQLIEIAAYKEVAECLSSCGIPAWADCGTALGLYRYEPNDYPMVPWDHDIDIAVLSIDHWNVLRALRNLDPEKYAVEDWSSYARPETFIRLRIRETNTVIDIVHFDINTENKTLTYNFSHEATWMPEKWKVRERAMTSPHSFSEIFPLRPAQYGDFVVYVPNQLENYLTKEYGERLDPARIWNEQQMRFAAVADHPYNISQGITDEDLTRQPST